MVQLVLWDIDHTLVATRGVGRELFGRAFREVTGYQMREQAAVDGMTDATIFRETATLHGIDTDRADFERFASVLAQEHLRHAPQIRERGHALPGAAAALSGIASLTGVAQTVVTGNVRGSAEIKLRVFGLDSQLDWSIGAYGEDDDERAQLVRIALERAAAAGGNPVPPADAVLIGDTPADVKAGHANGVRIIAVATGRSNMDDLREAGAETTLPNLADTEELLKLIAMP
ncbi:HAD family hydrolase [Streptomyces daliensis]|uniref:Haloacid dehalogenase-like hydrolase n=1 Tax=Streptomyces daliensis TaxID=299421 RepID=A0A8T4IKV6_9ACTN|nr:haloacid dehalogenase-like hydrolase [Streptomyces daliensis]